MSGREIQGGFVLENSDLNLLRQIASGNEEAMKHFFERHQRSVYTYALRRLDNSADAADVLNDVMLQVWRGAGRFAGNAKVTTWLIGIANHKVIDHYRQRGRAHFEELDDRLDDENDDLVETGVAMLQNASLIKHCMEKLSDVHRTVVHLAFYEDMPYPEIAELLGCPAGTVKTRMMHAKKNLKRCLRAFQSG